MDEILETLRATASIDFLRDIIASSRIPMNLGVAHDCLGNGLLYLDFEEVTNESY